MEMIKVLRMKTMISQLTTLIIIHQPSYQQHDSPTTLLLSGLSMMYAACSAALFMAPWLALFAALMSNVERGLSPMMLGLLANNSPSRAGL